jgi:hypothetical protein
MPKKPSSHPGGIEVLRTKIGIFPAAGRILLDFENELLDPRRCRTVELHWATSETRTVARDESVTNGLIKFDILSQRLFGRACRTTENAGCSDAGEKDTIERSVALEKRAVHGVTRRKRCHRHGHEFRPKSGAFHRKLNTEFGTNRVTASPAAD